MVINKGLGFPTTLTTHLDLKSAVTDADPFIIHLHLNTENPETSCALTMPVVGFLKQRGSISFNTGWEIKSL